MNSIDTEARQHAFLHQYLAHEAITLHGAGSIKLDIATDDHRGHLTFQAPEESTPAEAPQPPPKVMPPGVTEISQGVTRTGQGKIVHWSWTGPGRHIVRTATAYTRELLRFIPARVKFRGTGAATGGLDPRTHETVPGLDEELDEQTILMAVIAFGEPRLDWTSPEDTLRDNPAHPNIIFPHGLARTSKELDRNTTKRMFTGQLQPGEPRGPAQGMRLEFRVISRQNRRQRLSHPDRPGLNGDMIRSAVEAARRLTDRWVLEMERHGLSVLTGHRGRGPQKGHRIFLLVPSEPYGEPGATLAAHPVRIADEHFDPSLQQALEGALAAHTRFTAVRDRGVETILRLDDIRGMTHDDPPLEVEFHTSYGVPLEDPKVHRHHLVRPMREMTARGAVRAPDGAEEPVTFPVPALMTINREARDPDQMHKLYLTAEGRTSLTHTELRRLLGVPQLSGQQADTIAHAALEGRTEAFREELWALLGDWKPRAGWPDREMTVTFDQEGMRIGKPEE